VPVRWCKDLSNNTKLFFVPEGRLFIWPSFELGHRATVPTVTLPKGHSPIVLETLSASPRVFRIYNFFTPDESDFLIKNALSLTAEDYRLKRSSTGAHGYSIDSKRTSENAFDLTSEVSFFLRRYLCTSTHVMLLNNIRHLFVYPFSRLL
jgi:hypothetical protein